MTIEQKALELVNAVRMERDLGTLGSDWIDRGVTIDEALCRALEAHELDKSRHAAEMREQAERFSEAVKAVCGVFDSIIHADSDGGAALAMLRPFILAPFDPLAEELTHILEYAGLLSGTEANRKLAAKVLKAADALDRSLAIVKKEAVNG